MERCHSPHPEEGVLCLLPQDRHSPHTDGSLWWPDEDVEAERARKPAKIQERRGRAKRTASKASVDLMRSARSSMVGSNDMTRDEWVDHVCGVVEEFARTHDGEFTLPEHIWPLLDEPVTIDSRAMGDVVRRMKSRKVIVDTGKDRRTGSTVTRDGKTMDFNRPVTIFRTNS